MTKRRGRSTKCTPLLIGNDPNLWRFGSLQEALEDSTTTLAAILRSKTEPAEPEPVVFEGPADEDAEAGNIAAR